MEKYRDDGNGRIVEFYRDYCLKVGDMKMEDVFIYNSVLGMMCALMMDERLVCQYYFNFEKRTPYMTAEKTRVRRVCFMMKDCVI